jgi:hypothetical protein
MQESKQESVYTGVYLRPLRMSAAPRVVHAIHCFQVAVPFPLALAREAAAWLAGI